MILNCDLESSIVSSVQMLGPILQIHKSTIKLHCFGSSIAFHRNGWQTINGTFSKACASFLYIHIDLRFGEDLAPPRPLCIRFLKESENKIIVFFLSDENLFNGKCIIIIFLVLNGQ